MTTDDSHTRRDCLRTISAAGAVVGGGTLGVSSASAGGRPDDRTPSPVHPTDIALEAVCLDADHEAALFCVENDADRPAKLEWAASPVAEGIFFIDCQTIRLECDCRRLFDAAPVVSLAAAVIDRPRWEPIGSESTLSASGRPCETATFKRVARGAEDMSDEHDHERESGDEADGHHEPERHTFSHDPIGHAEVRAGMTVGELADEYGNAGVGAADLHEAVDVTEAMFDDDVTVFFSLAGAMVPTGMRAIVADLIREGYIDVLVTTGANLTHDAIEAIGGKHHHGSVHAEGKTEREHDETLRDEGVDRIYNVYLPQEFFATFESHLREEVFPPLEEECEDGNLVSIQRLTEELGRANADVNERDDVDEDPGIAAAAYENDVPIYCPAVQDSVLGLQAWMYSQTSAFSLDALADMTPLTDIAFDADEAGAFVVGGGVPKNFTLQTMLVTPGAYDYAVQLTMDPKQTGGLSGATLDEARSWGKLEKDAENVSVYADATITLPLVVAAARERLEN